MSETHLAGASEVKPSWLARFWVYTPLLICILLMLPRLISPQFGLMDDGRAITIAQGLQHGQFDLSWDVVAGRARPVYWAAFAFWYLLVGGHPFWYFLGNLIVFSATTFLLIRLVTTLRGSVLQAWLTGMIFVLSTSVIENIYTLSKAENFQVLLMVSAISLAILAARSTRRSRVWLLLIAAALLLLVACLTKESTLLVLPIGLVWWGGAWVGRLKRFQSAPQIERVSRYLVLTSAVSGLVFYVGRTLFLASSKILGVGQSSEFDFSLTSIMNGLVRWGGWLMRDYIWLVPMVLFVLVANLVQRRWPRYGLWWLALVWMVFWLGMYIPWHFAVEYYLLPFAAGTAVLAGVLLAEMIDFSKQPGHFRKGLGIFTLGITAILLLISQANTFTDAAIQLAQDRSNTTLLEYLAKETPQGSLVVVNLQIANEYIEQMQLMLANFYTRPDIQLVNYQGEDLSLLKTQAHATYFVLANLINQPRMTVRMGLDEPSLVVWNSSVQEALSSWHQVFQVSADPQILTVDFPRLLCPVIRRANYCAVQAGLVNYTQLHYQWLVFTP